MNRLSHLLFFGAALALLSAAVQPAAAAPTDAEVQARASALSVAGAFANDGFKTRDGHWTSAIDLKQPKVIQVNLYTGNHYWFVAAGSEAAKKLAIAVFDEKGRPLKTEPYENNAQTAAGFSPTASGPYYVRVEELEGAPAAFCLLYSYK